MRKFGKQDKQTSQPLTIREFLNETAWQSRLQQEMGISDRLDYEAIKQKLLSASQAGKFDTFFDIHEAFIGLDSNEAFNALPLETRDALFRSAKRYFETILGLKFQYFSFTKIQVLWQDSETNK